MDPAQHPSAHASLSDYLAVERTALAWIRTGLALMGFGFVVARFGVFLEQFNVAQFSSAHDNSALSPAAHTVRPLHTQGLAIWGGVALIGAGVLVHLMAGFHYRRVMSRLDHGLAAEAHHSPLASILTFFLALVGVLLVIYLVAAQHFL